MASGEERRKWKAMGRRERIVEVAASIVAVFVILMIILGVGTMVIGIIVGFYSLFVLFK